MCDGSCFEVPKTTRTNERKQKQTPPVKALKKTFFQTPRGSPLLVKAPTHMNWELFFGFKKTRILVGNRNKQGATARRLVKPFLGLDLFC